ncbi:hypothetical protein [Ferruginibacter sp.]|uniref:hypothetical protein n=1 Tax=Ferruginibacter sp. TaxID=1940288 RepID=UPI0019BEF0F0|nr:hypothetical protein [Ferruginibacter sp.]MBC7629207.1 hypothetical protein [Ferruginibacter sp.]
MRLSVSTARFMPDAVNGHPAAKSWRPLTKISGKIVLRLKRIYEAIRCGLLACTYKTGILKTKVQIILPQPKNTPEIATSIEPLPG